MINPKFLYITLMGLAFAGPFFLSFDKKVAFHQYFKPLLKATLPIVFVFVIWDILFTHMGVWGFNEVYTSGISLFGLPLGEYLFFLVIPYCCMFIYEVLRAYFPKDVLASYSTSISNFLLGFSASLAVIFYDKIYTLVNFALLTGVLFYFSRIRRAPWLGRFYQAFLVILLPFLIINSILTGSFIEQEIVWYSDDYMAGIRLGTIPLEDLFYAITMTLLITGSFEFYKGRQKKHS